MTYNAKNKAMISTEDLGFEIEEIGKPIELYARVGAKMLLEEALRREVTNVLEGANMSAKKKPPEDIRTAKECEE